MRNFFQELYDKMNEGREAVGGTMQCQERDCYSVVDEGIYIEAEKLLMWTCEEGHENRIEGFEL